mmetsp:Transcript_6743/g.18569  ORF Transcript_6743/g.18569 Transcript_6743/m.18569 type:complete len:243 (-) Transcript_6743:375-1103(-)
MPRAPGGNSSTIVCMLSSGALSKPSGAGDGSPMSSSGRSQRRSRCSQWRLRLRLRGRPPPRSPSPRRGSRPPLPPRSSSRRDLLPPPLRPRPPASPKDITVAHCESSSSGVCSSTASHTLGRAWMIASVVPMRRTIWWPSKALLSTKTLAPVFSRSALIFEPRGPMSAPVHWAGTVARKMYSPGSLPNMVSVSSGRLPLPRSRFSRSVTPTSTALETIASSTPMICGASPAEAQRIRHLVSG